MYVRAQIVSCTHIYLLFGVVLWNASALPGNIFRTRWLVHFPVYPTPPSPGWSRGASTYGPDFPESSYSLPPPSLSLALSRKSRSRWQDEGGFVWTASYLSRLAVSHWDADEIWRLANFPGRCYPWRRRWRCCDDTFAAFNRGLRPQPIPHNRELCEF